MDPRNDPTGETPAGRRSPWGATATRPPRGPWGPAGMRRHGPWGAFAAWGGPRPAEEEAGAGAPPPAAPPRIALSTPLVWAGGAALLGLTFSLTGAAALVQAIAKLFG